MAEQRDEHWRAFGAAWFERHQSLLLWLLNAPVLCLLVRWVFRIRSYDCPRDVEITHVGPNRFGWDHEDGRRTTIAAFLAPDFTLDVDAMSKIPDPALYRNRRRVPLDLNGRSQ